MKVVIAQPDGQRTEVSNAYISVPKGFKEWLPVHGAEGGIVGLITPTGVYVTTVYGEN